MRAKLRITKGSNEGKTFEINVPQFVIGRAPGCNLRPQSDAISRQHCAILIHKDHVSVRDLKSRNGTVLNGEAIKSEERMSTGDELQVGPLYFEVVVTDDAGTIIHDHDPTPEDHSIGGLPSDSGLISEWLMEEDDSAMRKFAEKETRQFTVDEENFVPDVQASEEDTTATKKAKKGKPEFGKLPKQAQQDAASSRDAAAETLRKMFNRGV